MAPVVASCTVLPLTDDKTSAPVLLIASPLTTVPFSVLMCVFNAVPAPLPLTLSAVIFKVLAVTVPPPEMCATDPAVVPAWRVTSPPLPSTAPVTVRSSVFVANVTPLPVAELMVSGPPALTLTGPPVALAVRLVSPVER